MCHWLNNLKTLIHLRSVVFIVYDTQIVGGDMILMIAVKWLNGNFRIGFVVDLELFPISERRCQNGRRSAEKRHAENYNEA